MATEQNTTVPRIWSTMLEREQIEYDLNELGIAYEDFYPTCRVGIFQIEAFGNAKLLAKKLDASPLFDSWKVVQDFMDDVPYALVMFRHFDPEEIDMSARWDASDEFYDERRLSR